MANTLPPIAFGRERCIPQASNIVVETDLNCYSSFQQHCMVSSQLHDPKWKSHTGLAYELLASQHVYPSSTTTLRYFKTRIITEYHKSSFLSKSASHENDRVHEWEKEKLKLFPNESLLERSDSRRHILAAQTLHSVHWYRNWSGYRKKCWIIAGKVPFERVTYMYEGNTNGFSYANFAILLQCCAALTSCYKNSRTIQMNCSFELGQNSTAVHCMNCKVKCTQRTVVVQNVQFRYYKRVYPRGWRSWPRCRLFA